MSNNKKTHVNVYREARTNAAKYNEKLNSREGAAELLNVHTSTVVNYELDLVKNQSVEMIVLMADLYNAPELLNHFCTSECPIGCKNMDKLEVKGLDRITINILSNLRDVEHIKTEILDITADGIIDEEEKPRLLDIVDRLNEISKTAQEASLWVQKNIDGQ